jgi:two-component system sensor histidine kinase ArlS
MQVKYRIILGYAVIMLLVISAVLGIIYQVSYMDRIRQYNMRLLAKAKSTSQLLKAKGIAPVFINAINNNSASLLYDKSILVVDGTGKQVYAFDQDATQPLHVPQDIIAQSKKKVVVYFKTDIREAVAYTDRSSKMTIVIVAADKDRVLWMSKLKYIAILCLVGGFLIFIIAGYFLAKRIAGSISALTTKLTQISSEAFSARLTVGKEKDELQELATTINNLLDRLQSSFDTQRRFLSNASHELTTPLAAISSQLDVALQKERTNEEYKKTFLSVKDDVKRLALLVRSILEIAKASGSVGGIELSKVRIDELLMRIPVEMKKISQLYDVKLNFEDFPESEGYDILYGNEVLLYSAFRNIIHNACKFSKDKCAKVTMSYTFQNIVIEVKDNGPGISAEELKNIFQPFFRGHKYENTQLIHGTGLGLSLAHRIIELHKGDIYVESIVGEGSTFTIYLPVDSTKTYKK